MEQLKKGYKKTELGVIPEDWEIVELNDITSQHGRAPVRPRTADQCRAASQRARPGGCNAQQTL
jgi:hypothetical protein